MTPKDNQDDTDQQNEEADGDGYSKNRLAASDPVDDKRPDEVELLLDLKRPEVVDIEMREDEILIVPENEVRGVGEVVILPAVPDEV